MTERHDYIRFESKEEAIQYGKDNGLIESKLYSSTDGKYWRIKKQNRTEYEVAIGKFKYDAKTKNIDYVEYNNHVSIKDKSECTLERMNSKVSPRMALIDGIKLKDYIENHGFNKKEIGSFVNRSRSFVNDAIRYNRVDSLALEKMCEYLNVPSDYFNQPIIEEKIKEIKEEPVQEFICEQIHDDLIALIASNRKLESLMQAMIDMWKND